MVKAGSFMDALPWYGQDFGEPRALMGVTIPYDIGPNRKTLETLFRYSHEQGLCSRKLTIEELFVPSSLALAE
jgi:4,5-dihydroxyphthalate decarboxylase